MAVLPIILAPDPRLKRRCQAVTRVDAGVRRLMDDLLETMRAANGVGLAAPQVGVHRRVLVVDVHGEDEESRPLQLADPELLWTSAETMISQEGCLSLPEQFAEVGRPTKVRVRFRDRQDKIREIEAEGLLAVCIQHEMDHLDGVLFVDHLSALKRNIILRKLAKAKRQAEAVAV